MKASTLGADVALGAIAGSVGTAAMSQVNVALYARQGDLAREQERSARGGGNTNAIAADKIAGLFGTALSKRQAKVSGTTMHYGLGAGSAAVYAAVRRGLPLPAVGRGLAFGAVLWLIADEIAVPASGITPGPRSFPWQTHGRSLAAHLTYGLITEATLSAADWLLDRG